MATHKLTDGYVKSLETDGRDRVIWDEALPRFGLRVTPAGRRIYLVQYRAKAGPGVPSVTRKARIGEHDGDLWNVTKARAAAKKLLGPVDGGGDPLAEREAKAEAAERAKVEAADASARAAAVAEARERDRFETVAERYIVQALGEKRSARETARLLRQGPAAEWHGRHVAAIRRVDVADLIDAIRKRSPATARLSYSALRGFFAWCIERELVDVSPCDHVKAPPRPPARDRVLSDEELAAVWKGADALGFPFGPVIKLLMLTGQREGEVAGMVWSEVDVSAASWIIPKERTKNGREHVVDLSAEALAIIEAVPRTGELLFPARRAPARKHPRKAGDTAARPVVGFAAAKRLLDSDTARKTKDPLPTAGLAPWRLHDLRRTAATGMAGMSFPPHVVERVLNHASGVTGGLVGVYQRHEYRPERKAALTAWGTRVAAIIGGEEPASNVRALRAWSPPLARLSFGITTTLNRPSRAFTRTTTDQRRPEASLPSPRTSNGSLSHWSFSSSFRRVVNQRPEAGSMRKPDGHVTPSASGSGARAGATAGALTMAASIAAAASRSPNPFGQGSARSHPSRTAGGSATTPTEAAPAARAALATALAASRPAASASGQITTVRPARGAKLALPTALEPPGQVATTNAGKRSLAASAAFSPSTTSTGAEARSTSAWSPKSGRGASKASHVQAGPRPASRQVSGRISLPARVSKRAAYPSSSPALDR